VSTPRPTTVVLGDVLLRAGPDGLRWTGAIGIAGGRVLLAGARDEVLAAAGPGARTIDAGRAVVVPGLQDFHIHLAGLARARAGVRLDDAADGRAVAERLRTAAATLGRGAWVTGRGWSEAQLAGVGVEALEAAVGDRPAFLSSHDGHSAWASAAARVVAGLGEGTHDPPGGRIERDSHGSPTGVLRETALDLVAPHVPRLQGDSLRDHLDATLRELAAFGVTGVCEAGDYTDANGIGADAALGDSYSTLTDLAGLVDGRLRLTLGIPADAMGAAADRGLRTGAPLAGRRTMRFGWAKEYADGALGSGTAALFAPRTCREADTGLLRVTPDDLDDLLARARRAGIGAAIHAIGDRAAATVLDAVARAAPRPSDSPIDRIEHAQLVRVEDRARFAALGVTASVQPIHAAADRDLVEDCWSDRAELAYAWRSLAASGALLAAGSDAPVESPDPWLGLFAFLHRRLPDDDRGDWRPAEALDLAAVLAAYTTGPASAIGVADEGHLEPGARADLAVLDIERAALLAGSRRMASARSVLTMVDGEEVPLP